MSRNKKKKQELLSQSSDSSTYLKRKSVNFQEIPGGLKNNKYLQNVKSKKNVHTSCYLLCKY